jgi:BlaI family penicillinase repressor
MLGCHLPIPCVSDKASVSYVNFHATEIDPTMAPSQSDVTEAELAVLEILWERGTATVRQIAEAVYPQCTSSEHATVQKLLDRLKAKNCVDSDRSVWPHQFSAAVQREQLIGRRLESMAERLCGGSLQPLLTHLVRNTKLSPQERRSLRALLDELDQEKTPPKRMKRV